MPASQSVRLVVDVFVAPSAAVEEEARGLVGAARQVAPARVHLPRGTEDGEDSSKPGLSLSLPRAIPADLCTCVSGLG